MISSIQDELSPDSIVFWTAVVKQGVGQVGHSFTAKAVPTGEEHCILQRHREKSRVRRGMKESRSSPNYFKGSYPIIVPKNLMLMIFFPLLNVTYHRWAHSLKIKHSSLNILISTELKSAAQCMSRWWGCCWHRDVCGKHRTLWWITKGSCITLFHKQTRPHLSLLLKAVGSSRGHRRHALGESDPFSGLLNSLLILLTQLFPLFHLSLRFFGCLYLFTSVHVFLKIPYSHDAFQAECPAAHKANLTIEEGLPHHQHLE